MIDPTYVTVICDNISYSNFNFCTSKWPLEKSLDEIILVQALTFLTNTDRATL